MVGVVESQEGSVSASSNSSSMLLVELLSAPLRSCMFRCYSFSSFGRQG